MLMRSSIHHFVSRYNVGMPSLVKYSIKIISDAGLGMAMFSLGTSINIQSILIYTYSTR